MKIYKTERHDALKIQELELIKQTEKSVWYKKPHWFDGTLKEERSLKITEYSRFFNTREEALDYLINNAESKLDNFKIMVENYTNILEKLRS